MEEDGRGWKRMEEDGRGVVERNSQGTEEEKVSAMALCGKQKEKEKKRKEKKISNFKKTRNKKLIFFTHGSTVPVTICWSSGRDSDGNML